MSAKSNHLFSLFGTFLLAAMLTLSLYGCSSPKQGGGATPSAQASVQPGPASLSEDTRSALSDSISKEISGSSVEVVEHKDTVEANVTIDGLSNLAEKCKRGDQDALVSWDSYLSQFMAASITVSTAVSEANVEKNTILYVLDDSGGDDMLATAMDGKIVFDSVAVQKEMDEEAAEKERRTSSDPNVRGVFVSASGTRYHASPTCSGMTSASEISLAEALNRGLTACKKCF